MFYREFLKITNLFDEHFVDTFDFWLTTLPDREARTISVSTVASRLEVKYSVAESIMGFAEKEKILKKRYVVLCANEECEFFYGEFDADELRDILGTMGYCHNCGKEFQISFENTRVVYERIKNPNVPESVIEDEIRKRESKLDGDINFPLADTLANNPKAIFEIRLPQSHWL